ncbi:GNAT family N-acetyltransferase [Paenibacillus sp. GCM10012303]|jgi:ribosomal protein S18 acetylase RimI-like enzyme|uniref:GNAT family N-acetyltransferase n=1 Tax=Paenibacillus sp. GCM10012303 TaxID=3317340 RepID=UPI0036110B26
MDIREMKLDDYEEAVGLWRQTEGLVLSEADSKANIRSFLDRNSGLSAVCVEGRRVVGTALCGHDGRRGFLYHVAVSEPYRGKGIAGRMVEHCLEGLRLAGVTKCHLFTVENNEIGNRYWSGTGWRRRDGILLYSRDLL